MRAVLSLTSPLILKAVAKGYVMPRNYDKHTDIQTDTRSRSRQYIGRAKDWVEWTLEEPKRVKNSVLPRWRSAAITYTSHR